VATDGLLIKAQKLIIVPRDLTRDKGIALLKHFNRFANVPESPITIASFWLNFQQLKQYQEPFPDLLDKAMFHILL
jgi:hypothetical protein